MSVKEIAYNFAFQYRYQLTLSFPISCFSSFSRLEAREVQSVVKRTLFNSDNIDFDRKFDPLPELQCVYSQYLQEKIKLQSYSRRRNGTQQTKLRGFSPLANYTDRATAVCRRS
jgi:hypothetical protein